MYSGDAQWRQLSGYALSNHLFVNTSGVLQDFFTEDGTAYIVNSNLQTGETSFEKPRATFVKDLSEKISMTVTGSKLNKVVWTSGSSIKMRAEELIPGKLVRYATGTNGVYVYYYHNGSTWVQGDNGMLTINGDGSYTYYPDANTRITACANGTFTVEAKKNGSFALVDMKPAVSIWRNNALATKYQIGSITAEGGDITLKVELDNTSCNASILDANGSKVNFTAGKVDENGTVLGGALNVYMSGNGVFGQDNDPLETDLKDRIHFYEEENGSEIISVDASLTGDSLTFADGLTIEGAEVNAETTTGDFTATNLTVTDSGELTLNVGGKLTITDTLRVDANSSSVITVKNGADITNVVADGSNSELELTVTAGDVLTQSISSANGGDVALTVKQGNLTASEGITLNSGNAKITVSGNETIGTVDVTGGTLDNQASGSITVNGSVHTSGGTVKQTASGGDITINGSIRSENGSVTQTAAGDLTVTGNVVANDATSNSSLTLTAGEGKSVTTKDIILTNGVHSTSVDPDTVTVLTIRSGKDANVGTIKLLESKTDVVVPGSIKVNGTIYLDPSTLILKAESGDLVIGGNITSNSTDEGNGLVQHTVTVEDQSTATFTAGGNLTVAGQAGANGQPAKAVSVTDQSTMKFYVGGDLEFQGSVNVQNATFGAYDNNGKAGGTSVTGSFEANNATVTINRRGSDDKGFSVNSGVRLTGTTANVTVSGDVAFGGGTTLSGGTTNITTNFGGFTTPTLRVENGNVLTLQAAKDIAIASNLTVNAATATLSSLTQNGTSVAYGQAADNGGTFTTGTVSVTDAGTLNVDVYGDISIAAGQMGTVLTVTGTDAKNATVNFTSRKGNLRTGGDTQAWNIQNADVAMSIYGTVQTGSETQPGDWNVNQSNLTVQAGGNVSFRNLTANWNVLENGTIGTIPGITPADTVIQITSGGNLTAQRILLNTCQTAIRTYGDIYIRKNSKETVFHTIGSTVSLTSENGGVYSDHAGNSWQIVNTALTVAAKDSVVIDRSLEITDSEADVTSSEGAFVVADTEEPGEDDDGESDCTITASRVNIHTGSDLRISHLIVGAKDNVNSHVTLTSDKGGYIGKEVSVTESRLAIETAEDVLIRNEENASADAPVVSVINSKGTGFYRGTASGEMGLYITSNNGGLFSDDIGNAWLIQNSKAVVDVDGDIAIKDKLTVTGSDASFTSHHGGMTTEDYGTTCASWIITNSTFLAMAAGELKVSHLEVNDSTAQISSLADSNGAVSANTGAYNVFIDENAKTLYYQSGDSWFRFDNGVLSAVEGTLPELTAIDKGISYQILKNGDDLYYKSGETYYVFRDKVYSLRQQVLSKNQKEECRMIQSGTRFEALYDAVGNLYLRSGDSYYCYDGASGKLVSQESDGTDLTALNPGQTYSLRSDDTGSLLYLLTEEEAYYTYEVQNNSLQKIQSVPESLTIVETNDSESSQVTAGGGYTGKTMEISNSSFTLDVYGDIQVVSDENDTSDGQKDVIDITNCQPLNGKSVVLRSRKGGLEAAEVSSFDVYASSDGTLYLERDGELYTYTPAQGAAKYGSLKPVADALDLVLNPLGEGFHLFDFTNDDVNHTVYLEKDHKYYTFFDGNLILDSSITLLDRLDMTDIASTNRSDSFHANNATVNVDVYGDINIRETVLMENLSVVYFTSSNGELNNTDYWYTNADDTHDMQMSQWRVVNSVMNLNINSNIRIDHLYVERSRASVSTDDGEMASKTWYFYGSNVTACTEKTLSVKFDDGGENPMPAVQIIGCHERVYFVDAEKLQEQNPFPYTSASVIIKVGYTNNNGQFERNDPNTYTQLPGLEFITGTSNTCYDNTLDLLITASTVTADVLGDIRLLETAVNKEVWGTNDTVNDKDLYISQNAGEVTDLSMLKQALPEYLDQMYRAYGTGLNIRSYFGGFYANNWVVEGALLDNGNLNVSDDTDNGRNGITALSIVSALDQIWRYNLKDEDKRIADRELTITDGSAVQIVSTDGMVLYQHDYNEEYGISYNYSIPDVVIRGDEASGTRATLLSLSEGKQVLPVLDSDFANISVRSAAADLAFDRIMARKSNIRLDAGRNLIQAHWATAPDESGMRHNLHSTITFEDKRYPEDMNGDTPDNASLTLRAGGDIGSAESWMYVNIPEALTLVIEQATNVFIDGQKRNELGETAAESDLRQYLVDQGYSYEMAATAARYVTAGGVNGTDYLAFSDEQFFLRVLTSQTREEILSWIYDRAAAVYGQDAGLAWLNTVNDLEASVKNALGGEEIQRASIKKFFGEDFARKLDAQLRDEDSAYYGMTYAEALNAMVTGGELEEEAAYKLFGAIYDNGEVVYSRDLLNQEVKNGNLADLINFLLNCSTELVEADGQKLMYKDAFVASLMDAVIRQSLNLLPEAQQKKQEAQNAFEAAQSAIEEAETQRSDALESIRQLQMQKAEAEAWKQYYLDQNNATAAARYSKQIDSFNKQLDALKSTLDEIHTRIETQQALAEEASLAMRLLDQQIARLDDGYADYDASGDKAAQTNVNAALDAANAAQYDTVSGLEAAAKAIHNALETMAGVKVYNETTLTQAIQDAVRGQQLAETILAQSADVLAHSLAALNDADTELFARQQSYQTAAVALTVAQKALADAQKKLNAAKTEAAKNAAQAEVDAAQAVVADAQNALDAQTVRLTQAQEKSEAAQKDVDNVKKSILSLTKSVTEANRRKYVLSNTLLDPDARKFSVTIGVTTGETYLYNEGSITVKVDPENVRNLTDPVTGLQPSNVLYDAGGSLAAAGDTLRTVNLTVGNIRSERGDIIITNLAGSILGAVLDSSNPNWNYQESSNGYGLTDYKNDGDRAAHVSGGKIDLYARDSIGSAERPLIIEERTNRPEKVLNVDESIYQGQKPDQLLGNTAYGTAFGIRFEDLMNPKGTLEQQGAGDLWLIAKDGSKQLLTEQLMEDIRNAYRLDNTSTERIANLYNIGIVTVDGETLWMLPVALRYDWIRTDDLYEGTELNAEAAKGSIYLTELHGDMNLGTIQAKQDIVLTTASENGSVNNVLTAEELESGKLNLDADGNVTVQTGSGSIGSAGKPLAVNVGNDEDGIATGGTMTAQCGGGIYVKAEDNLTLIADSAQRLVEVTAEKDISVSDIHDDSDVGSPDHLSGSALGGGSVHVDSTVSIGTAADPFVIQSDVSKGGTVSLKGDDVFVLQPEGDMLITEIQAQGDLVLANPDGDVLMDASGSDLGSTIQSLRDAIAAAAAAGRDTAKLEALLKSLTNDDAIAKAQTEYADAQTAVAEAQTAREAAQTAFGFDTEEAYQQALRQLLDSDVNGSNAEAVSQLMLKKQTLEAAVEALEAAQARLDAAKANPIIAYQLAQEALAQAKADFEADPTAENEKAVAEAQKKADSLYGDFYDALDYLSMTRIAMEQAKDAYDSAAATLGHSDGESGLIEETNKLDNLKAAQSAAQDAYDAALADETTTPKELAALKTALESAKRAVQQQEIIVDQLADLQTKWLDAKKTHEDVGPMIERTQAELAQAQEAQARAEEQVALEQAVVEAQKQLSEAQNALAEKDTQANREILKAAQNALSTAQAAAAAHRDQTADSEIAQKAAQEAQIIYEATVEAAQKREEADQAAQDADAYAQQVDEYLKDTELMQDAAVAGAMTAYNDSLTALSQAQTKRGEAARQKDDAYGKYLKALSDENATQAQRLNLYNAYLSAAKALEAADQTVQQKLDAVEDALLALQIAAAKAAAENADDAQQAQQAMNAAQALEQKRQTAQAAAEAEERAGMAQAVLDAMDAVKANKTDAAEVLAAQRDVLAKVEAQNAAQEAARMAQQLLDEAVEARNDAQSRYNEAYSHLDEAEAALKTAERTLSDAETAYQQAKEAYETAAPADRTALRQQMLAAAEAVKKAEAAIQPAQDTFQQAKQAAEAAAAELDQRSTEATAAKMMADRADAEYQTAQVAAEEAETIRDMALAAQEAHNAQNEAAEKAQEAQNNANKVSELVQTLDEALKQYNAPAGSLGTIALKDLALEYYHNSTGADVPGNRHALDERLTEMDRMQAYIQSVVKQISDTTGNSYGTRGTIQEIAQKALNQAQADADRLAQLAQDQLAAADQAADAVQIPSNIPADTIGATFAPTGGDRQATPGIQTGGNATILSGGKVGGQNDMSVMIGGELMIEANGDVDITSADELKISGITTSPDASVGITADGSITDTSGSTGITAGSADLSAVDSDGSGSSNVGGTKDGTFHTDVDSLSGMGDDFRATNEADTELGDINANRGSITSGGNLTGKQDAVVDVGDLTLKADDSIGSSERPLVTNTDRLTAIGKDLNLHNLSPELLVDLIQGNNVKIETEGSIQTGENGKIIARKDLEILANGNIGTPEHDLNAIAGGKLTLHTNYGHVFYTAPIYSPAGERGEEEAGRQLRTLRDEPTGIRFTAAFSADAKLALQVIDAELARQLLAEMEAIGQWLSDGKMPDLIQRDDHWDWAWPCETCSLLLQKVLEGKALFACRFDIYSEDTLTGIHFGTRAEKPEELARMYEALGADTSQADRRKVFRGGAYVYIDLYELLSDYDPATGEHDSYYDGSYEGQTLYVVLCIDGECVVRACQVRDGIIRFTMDTMGEHMMLAIFTEAEFTQLSLPG